MDIDFKSEILKLKKQRKAVILAHYYQLPEVQEIADYIGDSYYLSKIAKNCSESLIVFCGVKFMAESAKILSPEKTILLPEIDAGCPMADMALSSEVLELRKKHSDAKVVCYINSSADVKAESDVCCTSSNAVKIIKNLKEKKIIFLPDKNLGEYVQTQVPEKEIILWNGFCITHRIVKPENVLKIKELHPEIITLCHPECEKSVRDLADFIGSTGEIIDFATNNKALKFLIVTEEGVLNELKLKNPKKQFLLPENGMKCANMKKTSLKSVYNALLNLEHNIKLDETVRKKAYLSLINMHNLGR